MASLDQGSSWGEPSGRSRASGAPLPRCPRPKSSLNSPLAPQRAAASMAQGAAPSPSSVREQALGTRARLRCCPGAGLSCCFGGTAETWFQVRGSRPFSDSRHPSETTSSSFFHAFFDSGEIEQFFPCKDLRKTTASGFCWQSLGLFCGAWLQT